MSGGDGSRNKPATRDALHQLKHRRSRFGAVSAGDNLKVIDRPRVPECSPQDRRRYLLL